VTGRLKELIIIRGQNYYPHDIEATVQSSAEGLRAGSGAAFSVAVDGQERLVIIQELDRHCRQDPNEIIKLIREAIATEHQIPPLAVNLVKTGSIPKTSSGKIRRGTCRTEFLEGPRNVIAQWRESESQQDNESTVISDASPASVEALSQSLISWLAAKLAVEPSAIDPSQPISTYGLDSMGAIELMHSLERDLGVFVPVTTFFQIPSLTQLAEAVYTQLDDSTNRVTSAPQEQDQVTEFSLSRGQQALNFLHQLSPHSPAFNIAVVGLIRNSLDVSALRSAFQKLVERHPALRTRFIETPVGPLQRVEDNSAVCFKEVNAEAWTEENLNDELLQEANRSFDLQQGPLLRITLYRKSQGFLLLLVIHHIVSDFWSLSLIFNELGIFYAAERAGTVAELPAPKARYRDYVEEQRKMLSGSRGEQLWNYWKEKLGGELPRLELRTDRPPPTVQNHAGNSLSFRIEAKAVAALRRLSHECDTTLFTTLATAFMTLLHRYTGQNELLLGTVTSGRNSARFADLVGYFVNPVILKGEFSGRPSFKSLLTRMRTTVREALEHQDYPFPLLVERLQPENDASRSPLIQAMLVYQKAHLPGQEGLARAAVGEAGAVLKMGELEIESQTLNQRTGQFDLMLRVAETTTDIRASLDYDTELFDASTIEQMIDNFQTLIDAVVANCDLPISELALLTAGEERQLVSWNETRMQYAGCIHELFEAQVERTPHALALVYENQTFTYRELNARANRVAHHLARHGVGPEVRVALFAERSLEMVTGLLGILKAGGAYVPIDPAYPAKRISFMIEDANVAAVLTQEHLLNRIPAQHATVIALDSDWPMIAVERDENPTNDLVPDNAAYVIYTSGSTGQPKGVINTHAAVRNRLLWGQATRPLTAADRVLQKTPFSFDVSVWEFFWPLMTGA
ncbi:MAG TPA: condensation domain-containing protein, partial [Pyrinomonadaceae bacterium]|nr:condensation domain-containing protein [Pyrinomonadaceae bacterium]